ncbi:MAG: gamma-glutamyltransferase [Paracoccaceae bacterium]
MTHAVAAGHPLTAATMGDVLDEGGTAVAAVVAGAAVAMVAEPVLAGLFGGGFLMLREPAGRTRLLDLFVDTPARRRAQAECRLDEVDADFGPTRQRFRIGPASVASAGLAPGLAEAHARQGRMPMAELLGPAIRAAREGVRLTAYQARLSGIVAPILTATPEARALHADEDGRPLGEGAIRRNPDFAEVLEIWGIEGADFVQRGEVAAALAEQTAAHGHLTREDLARWRPVYRAPLETERGAMRLWLNPPPALGGALIALSLALIPRDAPPAVVAEAFALNALARRDSRIDADPVAGAARLAEPRRLDNWRALLRGPAGGWLAAARARPSATRGTTPLSAVDAEGRAAALTLSNGEGCGLIVPGTGIMANNMLGEDDLVPDDPFAWTPGVRLASMMAPTLIAWPDGRVAALGSGGSNRIRTALARVLARLADATPPGRLPDLEAAIMAPRLHVEGTGEAARLDYERDGRAEDDERALVERWPEACDEPRGWDAPSMFFGGVHAVARARDGRVEAVADPRRDGAARRS